MQALLNLNQPIESAPLTNLWSTTAQPSQRLVSLNSLVNNSELMALGGECTQVCDSGYCWCIYTL
eukprot:NODE_11742_length_297_cov_27.387097_g10829_i0.p1 GENE.NODE_11742_length_297_cov_27.387097_g10829_i0~~NODE_11742_length_297_cov_27.387097_g10829_i0.p1  ORF type:complete len:65 (+),score=8.38 NODE_11742_length_297_cov_27.387097_g10829_i0:45-239(+)